MFILKLNSCANIWFPGFIKEGDNSIMEYAENIDVLFANKTCQRYLEAARYIMKKDLCNMVQVLREVGLFCFSNLSAILCYTESYERG